MKTILKLIYLLLSISILSCNGPNKKNIAIDSSKVKSITITNKVDCDVRRFNKKEVIITDKKDIENILEKLQHSEPTTFYPNLKINNGFFEVKFYEGERRYFYTILYTIYDGVIVSNSSGGGSYKNDKLEIAVYKHFVNY